MALAVEVSNYQMVKNRIKSFQSLWTR